MVHTVVDDSNFDETVLMAKGPVLVDFWAPWCGPCKSVLSSLEDLAKEYTGKLIITKLNVDDFPRNASKYGVSALPTMLVFKNGLPMQSVVGYKSKNELRKVIDRLI